jgi:phosphoesterase RecJ-like protein
VVVPSPVPHRLRFLAGDGEIEVVDVANGFAVPDGAVVMLYDVSTPTRLGALEAPVRANRQPMVVFDHHDAAIEFDALALVDVTAGATAEIVFRLLEARNAPLAPEVAFPLYVALVADTGSFNYGKTTAFSHRMAARLLEAGVSPPAVHSDIEGHRTLAAVRAAGAAVAGIHVDRLDPRIAHATLSLETWLATAPEHVESGDIVNHTLAVEGVLAGVLLLAVAPRTTRVSMRSRGAASVLEVAEAFGGGGHRNAAGATVAGSPDEVRENVLSKLRAELARQLGPRP